MLKFGLITGWAGCISTVASCSARHLTRFLTNFGLLVPRSLFKKDNMEFQLEYKHILKLVSRIQTEQWIAGTSRVPACVLPRCLILSADRGCTLRSPNYGYSIEMTLRDTKRFWRPFLGWGSKLGTMLISERHQRSLVTSLIFFLNDLCRRELSAWLLPLLLLEASYNLKKDWTVLSKIRRGALLSTFQWVLIAITIEWYHSFIKNRLSPDSLQTYPHLIPFLDSVSR